MKIYKKMEDFINEKFNTNMTIPKDIELIAKLFHNANKDLFVVLNTYPLYYIKEIRISNETINVRR